MLRGHPHFPLSYNPPRRNRFHSHRVLFLFHDFLFALFYRNGKLWKFSIQLHISMFFVQLVCMGSEYEKTFSDIRTLNQTKVFILQPKSCSLPSRSTPAFYSQAMPFRFNALLFLDLKTFSLLWHFYHYLYFGAAMQRNCAWCCLILIASFDHSKPIFSFGEMQISTATIKVGISWFLKCFLTT